MKIVIGGDHGGYELKEAIKKYLVEKNLEVVDLGVDENKSVDYPEYGKAVGNYVVEGKADLGIVFCGTGLGISISANKVKGVRAALCTDATMSRLSREHNNANVLALGGRIVGGALAEDIVDAFLESKFEGGRHERRVNKIEG